MTLRSQIGEAGWADLLQAPTLLELGVAGVSPQGPIGSAREATALAMSLEDLATLSEEPLTGVLGEVAGELRTLFAEDTPDDDRNAALKPAESRYRDVPPREVAMETATRVMSALAGLAPEDTLGYREWLYRVADDVAGSANESGGLFKHGPAISVAEQALLDELRVALGLADPG